MRVAWLRITRVPRPEPWLLSAVCVIAGLLLAFGLIVAEVFEGDALAFDRPILLAFRRAADPSTPIGPPWLKEAARDITALGSHTVLGIVVFTAAGYFLLARERAAAWLVLVSVVGGMGLNHLLKLGFHRTRPDVVAPLVRVFTPSFPSGHATLSAITYLTLGALLARVHPLLRIRVFFVGVAIALTFLVGVSRIYLGVHFPTDVLAGWSIGAAWALLCWGCMTWLQRRGGRTPSEQPHIDRAANDRA